MSDAEQGLSERETLVNNRWPISVDQAEYPALPLNVLTGIVTSRAEGLTRTTLRLRIGERTDLWVRWPFSTPMYQEFEIGQTVRLVIPQEAVQLEAGGFRRGKQRWNRWIGRVVLTAHTDGESMIAVKIHQENITLKSLCRVIGAHVPLTTWDTVNIVVDPQRVSVVGLLSSKQAPQSPNTVTMPTGAPTSTWLSATLRAFRPILNRHHLSLNVGGATLTALIETGFPSRPLWKVGSVLEINLGSGGDAWIRTDAHSPIQPCCIVLSTEITDSPLAGSTQQQDQ